MTTPSHDKEQAEAELDMLSAAVEHLAWLQGDEAGFSFCGTQKEAGQGVLKKYKQNALRDARHTLLDELEDAEHFPRLQVTSWTKEQLVALKKSSAKMMRAIK